MMLVWTYGALVSFVMSFSMGFLLLRPRNIRTLIEGNIQTSSKKSWLIYFFEMYFLMFKRRHLKLVTGMVLLHFLMGMILSFLQDCAS